MYKYRTFLVLELLHGFTVVVDIVQISNDFLRIGFIHQVPFVNRNYLLLLLQELLTVTSAGTTYC